VGSTVKRKTLKKYIKLLHGNQPSKSQLKETLQDSLVFSINKLQDERKGGRIYRLKDLMILW
jgi:hypothetical protein